MGTFNPDEQENVIAGPILVKVNGTPVLVEGDHKYNYGAPKQEVLQTAVGQIAGVKRTPQLGKISGSMYVTKILAGMINEILLCTNGTIAFTLPSGKVETLTSASFVADGDIDTGSGKLDYEFNGEFV